MIDINLGGPLIEVGDVARGMPDSVRRGIALRRAGNHLVYVLGLTTFETQLMAQHITEPVMLRLWALGGDGVEIADGVGAILATLSEEEREKFLVKLRQSFCLDCGAQDPHCPCTRDE